MVKLFFGPFISVILVALAVTSNAQTTTPQIISVNPVTQDASPVVEIVGKGFSKDINAVKVLINDSGDFAQVIATRNKKIIAQIPGNNLCTGNINLRVIVNTNVSNTAPFAYDKGVPVLQTLKPSHALAGDLVEVTASNLGCDANSNKVTFNGQQAQVLSINGDKMTVKVPDKAPLGVVNVQVGVGDRFSNAQSFTLDTPSNGNGNGNGNMPTQKYTFKNTGALMSAGFTPLFNLNDAINVNGYSTNLWYVNFYGTQQAIVNAPWKTPDGQQQKALVTIDSRYSYLGTIGSTNGRYFYVLVQYPKHPELPFDEVYNPFFWGSYALVLEGAPNTNVTFNSYGKGGAGVESFEVTKDMSGPNTFSMSAIVVVPDLAGYSDYAKNYAQAGDGKVTMPKLTKLTMSFSNITPRVPIPYYNLGNVTMTDMTGTYGMAATDSTEFKAKLDANDITFFYPFF